MKKCPKLPRIYGTHLECCEKGEEESSKEEHQDQKDAHNLI